MDDRVLLVDDDPDTLEVYRSALQSHVLVYTARDANEALALNNAAGPFSVIVTDLLMPRVGGLELVQCIQEKTPDSVCMVVTGHTGFEAAVAAVNNGHVFRFIVKPCNLRDLVSAVEAGRHQYRLVLSEKDLLNKTLGGCVEILMDVLSLLNPSAFGSACRIKRCVDRIIRHLNLEDTWELRMAAQLCHLGCIILPADLLNRMNSGGLLNERERELFASHPKIGAELLAKIPRFKGVASMIAAQAEPAPDRSWPEDTHGSDPEVLGGWILRIALEYDRLVAAGCAPRAAADLLDQENTALPRPLLKALAAHDDETRTQERLTVTVAELRPRMVLEDEIKARNGVLLATRGQEVTLTMVRRLQGFAQGLGVVEPFRVRVPWPPAQQEPP